MKYNFRLKLLGIYDIILSCGAIRIGADLVSSPNAEYPKEWLTKVPFQSWFVPGIIGIVVFGLGNIAAALFAFRKKGNLAWIASTIMASILFLSIIAQNIIFKEWYLPAAMLLILSIIQLLLCGFAISGYKRAVLNDETL